jgi:2-keto-3-deoxy-L-rhamnonate aldolase RhmA
LGKRSVMGLGPALGYRAAPLAEINQRLNAETAVIVMLETAAGIDNAEAIAAVPGIDVLLIGSGDLSTNYGIAGQVDHPRLRAAYERVGAACKAHGKVLGVGGVRHNVGLQGELIRLGARFVIAGTDVNYVLAGARADTSALRQVPLG